MHPCLNNSRKTVVHKRQTTYWDFLDTVDNSICRIHFEKKLDYFYVDREPDAVQILDTHPVLNEFIYPRQWLYVNGKPDHPNRLIDELESWAVEFSDGWRSLKEYKNSMAKLHDILVYGCGLLLKGPAPFLIKAESILNAHGVNCSDFVREIEPQTNLRALLHGRNFVVAHGFTIESFPNSV